MRLGNRKALVGMHLFALIPGQGASQLLRQLADVLGKRSNNSRRVLAGDRASRSLIRLQLLGALNWTRVWFKANRSSPQDIGRQFVRTLRYGLERNRKQSRRTA